VYHIESRFRLSRLIIMGTLLCGLSFVVLQLGTAIGILYLGMLLLSLSEILAMPFMITLIMQRAGERSRGSYMGIYTMSWSLAFIVSPGVTTSIIDMAGYSVLWWFNGLLALITMAGFYVFAQKMEHKAIAEPVSQLLEHP
jgi:MFS family permease